MIGAKNQDSLLIGHIHSLSCGTKTDSASFGSDGSSERNRAVAATTTISREKSISGNGGGSGYGPRFLHHYTKAIDCPSGENFGDLSPLNWAGDDNSFCFSSESAETSLTGRIGRQLITTANRRGAPGR